MFRIARLLSWPPTWPPYDAYYLGQVIYGGFEWGQILAFANPDYPLLEIFPADMVGSFPWGYDVEPDQPP